MCITWGRFERMGIPSLFMITTPLTPLWLCSRFNVSSTSVDMLTLIESLRVLCMSVRSRRVGQVLGLAMSECRRAQSTEPGQQQ